MRFTIKSEVLVPAILMIFFCGVVLYGLGKMVEGFNDRHEASWQRFEKRMEKCAELPGRDYEGCMKLGQARQNVEDSR